jgi:Serine dehydrogenase proteinase
LPLDFESPAERTAASGPQWADSNLPGECRARQSQIDAELLRRHGLCLRRAEPRVDSPAVEAFQLMELYPQVGRQRPSVQFVPVPYPPPVPAPADKE